jgi:methionine synthase II (cobalamin-independent)
MTIDLYPTASTKFHFVVSKKTMATTSRRNPPFRAEHMGSLLRPQKLLEIRTEIRDKNVSSEEAGLPTAEKEAVAAVVKMQRDLGFKAVTDGEFVRTRFWGLMWDEFQGTKRLVDAEPDMFRLYHPDVASFTEEGRKVMPGESVIAGEKLWHGGESKSKSNLHELRLVQQSLPKDEWGNIKLTMITPAWFHMRYKQGRAYEKGVYANDEEYFKDVAKLYQAELEQLYKAGLRNVQFDDPGMACEYCLACVRSSTLTPAEISALKSSEKGGKRIPITPVP